MLWAIWAALPAIAATGGVLIIRAQRMGWVL